MTTSYKILFSTDQHLNYPKLAPHPMVQRFMRLMMTTINEHQPDALVLGGDWFDRPTSFTSKAGVQILSAMSMLLAVCNRKGIAVRVLKGTGTHDGVQNENWKPLAAVYKNLDFKVYNDVDIINDLGGMNILTIPDSTIANHHKCEVRVRELLVERGLESVDMGITHGMYTHHLEEAGFKVDAHDSTFYSSIVDILTLNGHIHRPSLYLNILTGGSTDRLRQGENHPKGIHVVDIDKEAKSFKATFIEQTEAAIFNSYDVMNEHVDVAIERLSEQLSRLDAEDMYVRLHYRADVAIRPIRDKLAEMYPNIVFDSVPNAKDVEAIREKRELEMMADIPQGLSPSNTIELFKEKFERTSMKYTDAHERILRGIVDELVS